MSRWLLRVCGISGIEHAPCTAMKMQTIPISALRTLLDSRGRVTIPKAIRDLAGLQPGLHVRMRARRDGSIAIELVKAGWKR